MNCSSLDMFICVLTSPLFYYIINWMNMSPYFIYCVWPGRHAAWSFEIKSDWGNDLTLIISIHFCIQSQTLRRLRRNRLVHVRPSVVLAHLKQQKGTEGECGNLWKSHVDLSFFVCPLNLKVTKFQRILPITFFQIKQEVPVQITSK